MFCCKYAKAGAYFSTQVTCAVESKEAIPKPTAPVPAHKSKIVACFVCINFAAVSTNTVVSSRAINTPSPIFK